MRTTRLPRTKPHLLPNYEEELEKLPKFGDVDVAFVPARIRTHEGIAGAARDYAMSLIAAGVDIRVHLYDPIRDHGYLPDNVQQSLAGRIGRVQRSRVAIVFGPAGVVERLPVNCEKLIYSIVWETDSVPKHIASFFNASPATEIWVPTNNTLRALRNKGVKKPVYVIPHALPDNLPMCTRAEFTKPFTFFRSDVWNERKNWKALVLAYLHAFSGDKADDVMLEVSGSCGDPTIQESGDKLFRELRNGIYTKEKKPTIFVDKWGLHTLEDDIEAILHSNCYVTTTRCEGWGMGPFLALAMGKPVIYPKQTCALSDWIGGFRGAIGVNSVLEPVHGMSFYSDYDCLQKWGSVDSGAFAEAMQIVIEDYSLYKRLAIESAKEMRHLFSYAKVGALMAERLRAVEKGQSNDL